MAGRPKENKEDFFMDKINFNNSISPLLEGDGKTVNNDVEKARVFNRYVFYIWK